MEVLYPPTAPTISKDKGTKIMEGMLLAQYQDKPILSAYFKAFIEEFDLLFEQLQKVHIGRMLAFASGKQLDTIGLILGVNRAVNLPIVFFGFNDEGAGPTPGVAGFADEVIPSDGGIFKSEDQESLFQTVPLSDVVFRRYLYARAYVLSKPAININDIYMLTQIILGFSPRALEYTLVSNRQATLTMDSRDVSLTEEALLLSVFKWALPMGLTLAITRI